MDQKVRSLGTQARDQDWIDHAARVGLVTYGVVHLLIGWLAVQLAFGNSDDAASSNGALKQLAEQPFGTALLWLVAIGMFLLTLWQGLEAVAGHRDEDGAKRWFKRAVSAGKAVIYVVLGVSAVKTATGSGSSGGTDSTTATIMQLPGGQVLVGLVALAIIGVGVALVHRAWSEKFRKHLDAEGNQYDAFVWFGKAGYTAKGVSLGVVGVLFGQAAITHDAKESGGLDQALQEVVQQPFGPVLLTAIALGIACYGLFCFAQARHLSR